jgi:hypothetical protein
MATALHGTKVKGKVKTPGICALLGLRPFTPHDLRRTAATLAGDLGFDDAWIAKCLDHAASRKQEQAVPSVTGKVYNHSKRMKEKARGAGWHCNRVAAHHRQAYRPTGNRTASRRLHQPGPALGSGFLLKHAETRRLVAVTGSLLPLWESLIRKDQQYQRFRASVSSRCKKPIFCWLDDGSVRLSC